MDPVALGLPHREPFIFVDRVIECQKGISARAVKVFPVETPFFAGHFPGQPIVPGVILAEALAQTCGIVVGEPSRALRLTALRLMKFPAAALPGEQIELSVRKVGEADGLWQFEVEASVGERVVATGGIILSEAAQR